MRSPIVSFGGRTPARRQRGMTLFGLMFWAIVIGAVCATSAPLAPLTFRLANSGMNFDTGSESFHFPCSQSCIMATPVIGLVMDAIRKMLSGFSASPVAALAAP